MNCNSLLSPHLPLHMFQPHYGGRPFRRIYGCCETHQLVLYPCSTPLGVTFFGPDRNTRPRPRSVNPGAKVWISCQHFTDFGHIGMEKKREAPMGAMGTCVFVIAHEKEKAWSRSRIGSLRLISSIRFSQAMWITTVLQIQRI